MFSNVNKQFLIFMFFIFLSCIFWLIMTLNETYEKEIKIPVQVVNIPQNIVLTSAATDTVRVTLRDKGWVLTTYLYGRKAGVIHVPFKTYDRGNGTFGDLMITFNVTLPTNHSSLPLALRAIY